MTLFKSFTRTLRFRFTGVMLLASLTFTVAVLTIVHREVLLALESRTKDLTRAQLEAQTTPIADFVLVEDELGLREYVNALLLRNPNWISVEIVDRYGKSFLFATNTQRFMNESESRHPAEYVLPLVHSSIGRVRVVATLDQDHVDARHVVIRIGAFLLVFTGLGISLATALGHWLTVPLVRMTAQVRRISKGDLGGSVPVPDTDDELAVLAKALNKLSTDLKSAEARQASYLSAMIEVEKLAAAGRLAAGVAHEVVNPLAGVAGCVRRLAQVDLEPERRLRYATAAEEGVERSIRVLRDLLVFAKPSGRPAETLQVGDLVERTLPLIQRSTGPVFVLEPSPDLLVVWPPDLVAQVLTNLLLNAQRFATHEVRVGWSLGVGGVTIQVVDDGPGLAPEAAARVFEPFFTTSEPGHGTGLGLAVSRSIVGALGGTISIGPRADGGSGVQASFTLPPQILGGYLAT